MNKGVEGGILENEVTPEDAAIDVKKQNNDNISYLKPDAGFHKDLIQDDLNDNMSLHYTIYDHRSYLENGIQWKDLSYHADRKRLNDDKEITIGKRIIRDGKFYGQISPPYSSESGINLDNYCLVLPPTYDLGIQGKAFTVLFYGKFNPIQHIPQNGDNVPTSDSFKLLQFFANAPENLGLEINIIPIPSQNVNNVEYQFDITLRCGNPKRVHTFQPYQLTEESKKDNFKIKYDQPFQTYAFTFTDVGIEIYMNGQSNQFEWNKISKQFPIKQIFWSNKQALINATKNIPLELKTFTIIDKPVSDAYIVKYNQHYNQKEIEWTKEWQKLQSQKDNKIKDLESVEQKLKDQLSKLQKCPFENSQNLDNPCNKECYNVVWSGQIINNGDYRYQQKPLTSKCAQRIQKYCNSQQDKEPACRCYDIDFAKDNAYCQDQLKTLNYLASTEEQRDAQNVKSGLQKILGDGQLLRDLNISQKNSTSSMISNLFSKQEQEVKPEQIKSSYQFKSMFQDIKSLLNIQHFK